MKFCPTKKDCPLEAGSMAWINPAYVGTRILNDVRRAFDISSPNSIQLQSFLSEDNLKKLRAAINKLPFKKYYIPDLHCYEEAKRIPKELRQALQEITALVHFISGKKLKCKNLTIRRFGKKHYTVLHDVQKEKSGVDFVLDLTPEWNPSAGGALIYTRRGEDVLTIIPAYNTFSTVNRTRGMMRFVKYINHHAQNKRVLVQGTFR